MDEIDSQVAFDFALLFRGGKVAIDDPADSKGFRPWQTDSGGFVAADGKDFVEIVEDHLLREPAIGVYPLFHLDGFFKAYWGCVDWDAGLQESLVHARNVYEVLRQLGVRSWVEQSRSKGFHVWVFFQDAMPAVDVREGLLGACAVVEAPAKEVNPKQVTLVGRKIGNGMRLPYPVDRQPTRNEMVDGHSSITVADFVAEALETRITPENWEQAHDLYRRNEPAPVRRTSYSYTGRRLTGMAEAIRRTGPRQTPDKPHGDRSMTLFSLACAMIRQSYGDGDIINELKSADEDWGGKYATRPDGEKWLRTTVVNAQRRVG